MINSFDVFDTLIARKCIEPFRIFDQVAEKANFPQFPNIRKRAEAIVAARGPYSFDDIYREIPDSDKLKELELEIELDNVIPVNSMMMQVQDGDYFISDMYHSKDFVSQLLDKAGFRKYNKKVMLHVTSNGKSSGWIWKQLPKIELHRGDSDFSDVQSPRRAGIKAERVTLTRPTQSEEWLIQLGFRSLALLCREMRLWYPTKDPLSINLHTSVNFPMLYFASVQLARFVEENKIKRVMFSSRDAAIWCLVFHAYRKLIGLDCEIEYFYTSRLCRRNPSESYKQYARKLQGKSLLVDFCGTGWSGAHLLKTLELDTPQFLMFKLPKSLRYERVAPSPPSEIFSICSHNIPSNFILEIVNSASHGTVVDVKHGEPVLGHDNRSKEALDYIDHMNRVYFSIVNRLDEIKISVPDDVSDIIRKLGEHAVNETYYNTNFQRLLVDPALEEDKEIYKALGV